MGSKIEYVESSHMYATNYIRNSKAIGVLWGIFTICYAIIGVVAFVTPEWLGDLEHENPGRFGLWMRCSFGGNGEERFVITVEKQKFPNVELSATRVVKKHFAEKTKQSFLENHMQIECNNISNSSVVTATKRDCYVNR